MINMDTLCGLWLVDAVQPVLFIGRYFGVDRYGRHALWDYDGGYCTVDNKDVLIPEQEIRAAYHGMMSADVDESSDVVAFRYRPNSLFVGRVHRCYDIGCSVFSLDCDEMEPCNDKRELIKLEDLKAALCRIDDLKVRARVA